MSKNDTPMDNSKEVSNEITSQASGEDALGKEVLSEDELMLLSSAAAAIDNLDTGSKRMQSLREKIMAQVDEQKPVNKLDLLTIRADSGDWKNLSDKIRKKVLHVDEQSGIETFLLKIEAGAKDAPHIHSSDEHCIVLEGDVSFGDVHLKAGDYHMAQKGSRHDEAYSVHGALLYIQTGLEQPVPV